MAKKRRRRRRKKNRIYILAIIFVVILMVASLSGVWIVFQKLDANEKKARQDRQEALREQELETKEEKAENAKQVMEEIEKEESNNATVSSMTVVDEPANASELSEISISNASASSELQQSDGSVNTASLAFDGNEQTSWQDGVEDAGVGENITAELGSSNTVKYISFKLGNWSNEDYYRMNNRPKSLEISAGSQTGTVAFKDEMKEVWVQMPDNTTADTISFVIKSIYEGEEWNDTCISEIVIYGEAASTSSDNATASE